MCSVHRPIDASFKTYNLTLEELQKFQNRYKCQVCKNRFSRSSNTVMTHLKILVHFNLDTSILKKLIPLFIQEKLKPGDFTKEEMIRIKELCVNYEKTTFDFSDFLQKEKKYNLTDPRLLEQLEKAIVKI